MLKMTIEKPNNYKSHFIVYDPNPKLVISFTDTHFQAMADITKDNWREFTSEETDTKIIITETED